MRKHFLAFMRTLSHNSTQASTKLFAFFTRPNIVGSMPTPNAIDPRALAVVVAYLREPLVTVTTGSPADVHPNTLAMCARVASRRLDALAKDGGRALTSVRRAQVWVTEQRAPFRGQVAA